MNLTDFLEKKEKKPELLWSIIIEEGWVQAGIWYIGDKAAEVLTISLSAPWKEDGELIEAVDTVLSSSIQKLPEEYQEPNKTVFGVSSSWVKNGEIAEEYLGKIKKLCEELSLTPVGFVVLPEAIAHLYKSEEGTPVSAIILGLGVEFVEISVFKLGNLVGTTQVARSVSLTEDVVEGLSRFESASPLPSRVILFDGKETQLGEARETLTQAEWNGNEKIKFLHPPKIEILSTDRKVLAVSLAGANEMGDVTQVVLEKEEVVNVVPVENEKTVENLGFVIDEEVPNKDPETSSGSRNIFHNFSMPTLPKFSFNLTKKPLIIFLSMFLVLILSLGLAWWFYPKAVVAIYVTPKNFEQEVDFAFNSSNSQVLTTEVSGEKSKAATGSKTVGDKAKGTVQIQNGTALPINLAAGTFLLSSGSLKFSLDNSASVSAALSPSSPGTATVNVTAETIGADHNLAKDEVFRVGNYPKAEVDAKSTTDFSGGSSTQILAVSKDDQTSLEKDLKAELSQNATNDLSQKVTDSQIFVGDLASLDVAKETFDHKVGDQVDKVKLKLSLEATGIAADRTKLLELARGILKSKIPAGFVLRDSQINFKFTFVDAKEGNFNYKITMNANFLPAVNTANIIKQISGKTPEVVENYLSKVPGFSRATITLKPRLPGIFGTLPRVHQNITIEVSAEN
ncbi:MAG TPA: baseplate J/gp47 family protein [Alphaproteobacteria bacterium]|jgi:hypothetical protein|nr:baseplate J/gp47 family protein [Alphaproteobacteria bacterium]